MSQFRTPINPSVSGSPISLKSPVLTIGSCFSDSIGLRMNRNKFSVLANPFGTVYNSHSIHKLLLYAIHKSFPPDNSSLRNNDIFLNYDFHSEFSALSANDLNEKIRKEIDLAHAFLKNATHIIITYGTSWIYERMDDHEIVANCHKRPASEFSKSLFTHKKTIDSFERLYSELKKFNPGLKIILTVSPVRHIKDTLELNSVSKSVLRLVCHSLCHSFKDVDYFPAYEIMMDDLRDYRFYKTDMLHPTEDAEDYIWQKFLDAYVPSDVKNFMKQWHEILSAMAHKPFHPTSLSHQQFLKTTLTKLRALSTLVNTESEIAQIEKQIL